jgi:hypothetical protein
MLLKLISGFKREFVSWNIGQFIIQKLLTYSLKMQQSSNTSERQIQIDMLFPITNDCLVILLMKLRINSENENKLPKIITCPLYVLL